MTTSIVKLGIDNPKLNDSCSQASVSKFRAAHLRRFINSDWLRCLCLLLVGLIARLPALQGQRIWDDKYLVRDNPFIKSPLLILESFRHYLFLDSYSSHYRPVQNISFMFDYFFWNTNEFGFHLTNVLLHIGSAILLYFLLRQLFAGLLLGRLSPLNRDRVAKRMPWISHVAFLIAFLWSVHPVHSAAIDYISGRADSLAFFCAAAGWLLFLHARKTVNQFARTLIYVLTIGLGLLALCSREIALIWIFLFIVYLFFVERRMPSRTRLCALVCSIGVVLVYAGLRHLPAYRQAFPGPPGFTAPIRATLMIRALGDYARLMVWPSRLYMERSVFDPGHYLTRQTWRDSVGIEYLSMLGLVVIGVLLIGSIKKGRWQAMRIFGATWFIAAYLPVSNIMQLNATAAEHWLYLPSVGLLIFGAGCLLQLQIRLRPVVITAIAVAITALTARSFVRSTDWVDEETFYKRTFEAGSRSARVAVNLGQVYSARGAYSEAENIFRLVLDQNPDYPIAQNNLASVLARQGKNKEAEAVFAVIQKNSTKTRQEYPRTWIGALNLANVRHNARDDEAALAILERAHNDYPEVWELLCLKAEIIRKKQGPDVALRLVEDFARANWWHHGAALALGRLYAQTGDPTRAEAALSLASRLDVHDTQSLRLMVDMRVRANRLNDALLTQRRAISRQPDQPSQYVLLSDILEKMGRNDEARAALAEVSRLRALANNQTVVN